MRVLFVYPSIHPSYPLQIGALSAFIKQRGHQTNLFNFESKGSARIPNGVYGQLEKEIASFNPSFVAFSCYEMSFPIIKKLRVDLEKRERVASYAWESILDHPILSQTEIRLAKYLNSLTAVRSRFFWNILFGRLKWKS